MTARVPDQNLHWNRLYTGAGEVRDTQPSAFARFSAARLPRGTTMLELGCGAGVDARWFARRGCTVTATDFSPIVVGRNQHHPDNPPDVTYRVVDSSAPLPFPDGHFDAVYAHLSLHYFPRDTTLAIFEEIRRVLRPGGAVMFLCKSTADPLHGQGEELEPDMYLRDGHVRHFFSDQLVHDCLADAFRDPLIDHGTTAFHGRESSAWIRVIARTR